MSDGEPEPEFTLSPDDFDAVLLDLDGVVTRTARVHSAAWKETFDTFLEHRDGPGYTPFDPDRDYAEHVDGRPRYDGVATFLAARGIDLPRGGPDDPPGEETVCALGNRKNRLFLSRVERDGVTTWPDAVELLRRLREAGLATAVVSSSANCREIVAAAGLSRLFDTRVDGVVADELDLAGKPAPDFFAEAARRLGAPPGRAVVVEDSVAGVEAGRRGKFGAVVGVDRTGHAEELERGGADVVVDDLASILVPRPPRDALDLPLALDLLPDIAADLAARGGAVFLDYDGTLTPIVATPDRAVLPPATRRTVARLAGLCRVAVVSGRDRPDVERMVGLPGLGYAGSHGFDIAGPGGVRHEVAAAVELRPELDAAREEVGEAIRAVSGARIETKRFGFAVHYRQVEEAERARVGEIVEAARRRHPGLRCVSGKMVHELLPDVEWDKGRAVAKLVETFRLEGSALLYLGDDTTDEDAFRAVRGRGVSVLVSDVSRPTVADCRIADPEEVREFLSALADHLEADFRRRWILVHEGYEPEEEGLREALCTLSNGYFATRGAASFADADGEHYPGTYLAGGYDRLVSEVAGREVENEDLVNFPNWLPLSFRPEGGEWLAPDRAELLEYRQELDLFRGLLSRTLVVRDEDGRETRVAERRFVHMRHPHLAGLEVTITPRNWSGPMEVRSALDGRVVNAGVPRYSDLDGRHLVPISTRVQGTDRMSLLVATRQSDLRMAQAARTRFAVGGEPAAPPSAVVEESGYVARVFPLEVRAGRPVTVEKTVALYTSRDRAIADVGLEARAAVERAPSFAELLEEHELAWRHRWGRFDIELALAKEEEDGERTSLVLHLYLFHLLQTTSDHVVTMGLDVGVPSRGWHGEAYRGHVFWDELFIFPLLNFGRPEITRALLLYRYHRLGAARDNARAAGFAGAMYPWQSGSNGREESQRVHLNPRSGNWVPDDSRLQRHVNAAIAHNVFRYYQATADTEFLAYYGAEMVLEIARFWASIATFDERRGRYVIRGVVGPDEYHDRYPGAEAPGLDNNAYTNVMAAWVLRFALDLPRLLPADQRTEIWERLGLTDAEAARWLDVSRRMYVPIDDAGLLTQFEGYERLEEFDWKGYRERYDDIQRLDRLLEAEGDTPNRYRASKQADVLMLFYLFSSGELVDLFRHMGYAFPPEAIPRNIEYYLARTSHGSTLSRVVHAWVLARSDREASWRLFREALESDVSDIQGGTTPEGIHLGAMAGVADILKRCYTGLEARDDALVIDTALPREVARLSMRVRYRGHTLDIRFTKEHLRLVAPRGTRPPIRVVVNGRELELRAGDSRRVPLFPDR